jgi:hypothetical protein
VDCNSLSPGGLAVGFTLHRSEQSAKHLQAIYNLFSSIFITTLEGWVWNLVSHIKERAQFGGVWEQVAAGDIWIWGGWRDRRLQNRVWRCSGSCSLVIVIVVTVIKSRSTIGWSCSTLNTIFAPSFSLKNGREGISSEIQWLDNVKIGMEYFNLKAYTGSSWFRTGNCGGFCKHCDERSGNLLTSWATVGFSWLVLHGTDHLSEVCEDIPFGCRCSALMFVFPSVGGDTDDWCLVGGVTSSYHLTASSSAVAGRNLQPTCYFCTHSQQTVRAAEQSADFDIPVHLNVLSSWYKPVK